MARRNSNDRAVEVSEIAVEKEWTPEGEYGWTHSSGWTIGRYIVSGSAVFLLWQGREIRGRFDSFESAAAKHAELAEA
ncbi:hypothetical protein CA603_23975 [Paraburkholderia hospita]|nr:hypothetical protein CA603_23975 [Paraburkholderia hospita]